MTETQDESMAKALVPLVRYFWIPILVTLFVAAIYLAFAMGTPGKHYAKTLVRVDEAYYSTEQVAVVVREQKLDVLISAPGILRVSLTVNERGEGLPAIGARASQALQTLVLMLPDFEASMLTIEQRYDTLLEAADKLPAGSAERESLIASASTLQQGMFNLQTLAANQDTLISEVPNSASETPLPRITAIKLAIAILAGAIAGSLIPFMLVTIRQTRSYMREAQQNAV